MMLDLAGCAVDDQQRRHAGVEHRDLVQIVADADQLRTKEHSSGQKLTHNTRHLKPIFEIRDV